jgi:hypothetical protein
MIKKIFSTGIVAIALFGSVASAHAQPNPPPAGTKKSCKLGRTTIDHGGKITGTAIGKNGKQIKVSFACNDGKIVVIG